MNDVVPLLKHTPSAQRPEILEAITVQREPLIAALVEAALDERGGLRHHLLVGPRGIGKTHVLSLVASRVRAADPEARRIVVAWLDEDPWGVRTYGKFLAAIAARVAEAVGDAELEQTASALRAAGAAEDGPRGEELVRRAVGGRRLVLLVENLDETFRRIGVDGQMRFRAFAEDWGRMLVLASTPQLFAGVRAHASPFYGFFAVTHLDELSLENAADLLRRIARLRRNDRLLRFLGTDVAMRRLRAIEALAGGHPRVWLLLAGCISVAAIDKLVPLFLEALDDLTPYYQARLHELGDQPQEIVLLLSEAGGALSNRALSERSGIAERQVATILKQLSDRGYVRRARLPEDLTSGDKRMSHWELREPLMRLCLDVKQARGEPLRIVVEFLRAWYGPRLLDELNRLPPTAELANVYASEAFRTLEMLSEDDLMYGTPEEMLERAERGLALRPDDRSLWKVKAQALFMQGRVADARDLVERLAAENPVGPTTVGVHVLLAFLKRSLGEKVDPEPVLGALAEIEREPAAAAPAAVLRAFVSDFAGRYEEAAVAYRRAIELNPGQSPLLAAYGVVLGRLGRDEEALVLFDEAAELTPGASDVHDHRGTALSRLGRYEEALEAFTRAAELAPGVPELHDKRGSVLIAMARPDEALAAYSRAAELDPSNLHYLRGRALTLLMLGHYEAGVRACDEGIALDPGAASLHGMRGVGLEQLGRLEEALAAYTRAAELDDREASYPYGIATTMRHLGRFGEAEEAARRAVALDGENPYCRFALTEAVLAGGDVTRALTLLDEALEVSASVEEIPNRATDSLCELVWERYRRDPARPALIARLAAAYRRVEAVEQLGRGVVAVTPSLLDETVAQEEVDGWVENWRQALTDAEIPLQMLAAAGAWKRDRDQAHLLALPPEQREILLEMLPR
jgi:tetratricopeptide (TPR) repeat protein